MKHIIYRFSFIVMAAFMMCSCMKELDFKGEYLGEKLVLYSVAVPGEPLTAQLTKSHFFLSRNDDDIYGTVPGAKLAVVVNGEMTYGFREVTTTYVDFFGYEYDKIEYVSDYVPAEGDRFKVMASLQGFQDVEGESVVPEAPEFKIESASSRTVEKSGYGWTEIEMKYRVRIDDPAASSDWYRLEVFTVTDTSYYSHTLFSKDIIFYGNGSGELLDAIEMDDESFVPSCFSDEAFNGTEYGLDFWFRLYYYEEKDADIPDIDPTHYELKLTAVSEDLYLYQKSVDAYDSYSGLGQFFSEPVSIHNNVKGGIGCVGAMSGKSKFPER